MDTFLKQLHLPVTKIDDSKRMLAALKVSSELSLIDHSTCMNSLTGTYAK